MYLIISEVDGYFKEKNGSKYLDLADQNKEELKTYIELYDEIKNEVETINESKEGERSSAEYDKDFIKIKFDADDNLRLNKTPKLNNATIVIRSVFEEDGKFYPQIYLDECLYEL